MNHYLFIVLARLQVADVYTTLRILDSGGYERNRAMTWLMRECGAVAALVLAKCLMLVVLLMLIESLPVWFVGALCVFYVGIVVNNVRELHK